MRPPAGKYCFLRAALRLAAIAAGLLLTTTRDATAQTWTGGGGANGAWSESSNWSVGVPVGSSALTLTFGSTTGTTTLDMDLTAPLLLNRLTFTMLGSVTASSFTLNGGALRFEGTAPVLSVRSNGATVQTINNQIILGGANGLEINSVSTGGGNSSFVLNGDITGGYAGNVTLTLAGGATRTSYLNGVISDGDGTLSIIKYDAGHTYQLSNANNSFSGAVTIRSGTLHVTSLADAGENSALGRGNNLYLGSVTTTGILSLTSGGNSAFSTNRTVYLLGAAVIQNLSADSAAALTLNGTIVTSAVAGTKTLSLSGTNLGANTVATSINDGNGAVALYKQGTGLWILSGANNFSGGTTVAAGSLRVTDFAANLGGGSVRFVNSTASVQNVLEASGTLTASLGTGAGQITWDGHGGFAAGATSLTVRLNNNAVTPLLWGFNSFVPNGAQLQLGSVTSSATVTWQNPIDLNDAERTIRVFDGAAAVDAVISGTISSGTPELGALVKEGPGTLQLTASNSFSGVTTIRGGLLTLGDGGSLTGTVATVLGGDFGFNGTGTRTYSGSIIGAGGVRILSGTVALNGANSYSAGTTVYAGGTLRYDAATPSAVGLTYLDGGTLSLGQSVNFTAATLTSLGGKIIADPGASLATDTLMLVGGVTEFSGVLSSTSLRLMRGTEMKLTPGETYTVRLGTYSSSGAYAPLKYLDSGNGTGGAKITGAGSSLWMTNTTHAWFEIADTPGVDRDLEIQASIVRAASASWHFLKLGAGTLYLPNASPQLAANVWFYNGTIEIGDDLALGTGTLNLRYSSAGLGPAGAFITLKTDEFGGPAGYTLKNPVQFDSTGDFGLAITGPSSLTLTGVFTNSSTATRTVYFNTDPGTTAVIDKLMLSNHASTTRSLILSGAGYGIVNSIAGSAGNPTLGSNLIVNATGTILLSGNNTYGGLTTVYNGTVLVGHAGAFGSGSTAVTLSTSVASASASVLTAGAVTLARNFAIGAGAVGSTVALGGNTAVTSTFSGNITFSQTLNLTATTGGAVVFSGALTGSEGSGIRKTGGGLVRLVGNNDYAGPSTVAAGILHLAAGGTLTGTVNISGGTLRADGDLRGRVIVQTGGTLQGTGSVGAVAVAAGGTLAAGNSVGMLTIDGQNAPGGAQLTLTGGARVEFEFRDANNGPGVGWDLVDLGIGGTLHLLGVDAANRIQIRVASWLADNSAPGPADDFNFTGPNNHYAWLFIRADNLTGLDPTELNAHYDDYFDINDDGVFVDGGGPFARPDADFFGTPAYFAVEWIVDGANTGLYLTYHAVPEPGSSALTALAALGGYRRWKRRKAQLQRDAAAVA